MQYLKPPSSSGPSGKTWPRCESEVSLRTSVRRMPNDVSTCSDTSSSDSERAKLGQPHEVSNLSFDVNCGLPLSLSTYIPSSKCFHYSFSNGASVAFSFISILSCSDNSLISFLAIIFHPLHFLRILYVRILYSTHYSVMHFSCKSPDAHLLLCRSFYKAAPVC